MSHQIPGSEQPKRKYLFQAGNKLSIGNDSVAVVKQSTKSKNAFSLLDSGTTNNSHQEETKQPAPTKILSKVTDIDSTQAISSKIQHKEEIDEERAKSFMTSIFQEYLEGKLEEFKGLGTKYEREDFSRIIIPLFFSALADSKADLMKKLPICLTEYLNYLYSENIITIEELTKGISLYIQNYYENEVSEAPQFPEALEGVICNLLKGNIIILEELEIFPNKKELDEDDFLDERMKLNIGIVNRLKIEEIITDREQLVGYWERTGKEYLHMKENYMLETELHKEKEKEMLAGLEQEGEHLVVKELREMYSSCYTEKKGVVQRDNMYSTLMDCLKHDHAPEKSLGYFISITFYKIFDINVYIYILYIYIYSLMLQT